MNPPGFTRSAIHRFLKFQKKKKLFQTDDFSQQNQKKSKNSKKLKNSKIPKKTHKCITKKIVDFSWLFYFLGFFRFFGFFWIFWIFWIFWNFWISFWNFRSFWKIWNLKDTFITHTIHIHIQDLRGFIWYIYINKNLSSTRVAGLGGT